MKIWIRVVLGAALGIALGAYLPERAGDTAQLFGRFFDFIVGVGRYLVFPMIITSIAVAVFELRDSGRFVFVLLKAIGTMAVVTVATVVLSVIAILVFAPSRIPPILGDVVVPAVPSFGGVLQGLFPENLFSVFRFETAFILPAVVFAVLLGLTFRSEHAETEPVVAFFDSLNRVFYRMTAVFVDIIGIGIVALAAFTILRARGIEDFAIFGQLVVVQVFISALIGFGLLPLVLYLVDRTRSPFQWLLALVPAAVTAAFSADAYFTLAPSTRMIKENVGIPRMIGGFVLPLATILGRAGTAAMAGASFIVVLRSYTALDIQFTQIVWVIVTSCTLSFLLGSVPGAGLLVALTMLSAAFGRGMDDAYLILVPIVPVLAAISAVLDVMASAFVTTIVAIWEDNKRDIEPYEYV